MAGRLSCVVRRPHCHAVRSRCIQHVVWTGDGVHDVLRPVNIRCAESCLLSALSGTFSWLFLKRLARDDVVHPRGRQVGRNNYHTALPVELDSTLSLPRTRKNNQNPPITRTKFQLYDTTSVHLLLDLASALTEVSQELCNLAALL